MKNMFLLRFLFALVGKGNSKSISDEEAVEKYLKTQKSFYFDLLYERYSPKIFAKSISLVNDHFLAQDCTQEIMMKLLLNLSKFSHKSKFSTWVYSITYNYCIDKIRKRKKERSVSVDDFSQLDMEDDSIEDKMLMEIKVDQLRVIMDEIPVDDKSILMMKYMDSMSIREIGEVTNKTESAVKMKIKRAKQKFVKIHNEHFQSLSI